MVEFKNFDHNDHVVDYSVVVTGGERENISNFFRDRFKREVNGVFLDSRVPRTKMSVNYKVVLDNGDVICLKNSSRLQDAAYADRVHRIQNFLARSECPVPEVYSNDEGDTVFQARVNGDNDSVILLSRFVDGNHYGAQIDLGKLGEAYGKVYAGLKDMGTSQGILDAYEKRKPSFWSVVSHGKLDEVLALPLALNADLQIFHDRKEQIRAVIDQVLATRLLTSGMPGQVVLWDPHPHNVIVDNQGNPFIYDFENAAASVMPVSLDIGMAMHRSAKMDLSKMQRFTLANIAERCLTFVNGVKKHLPDIETRLLVAGALDKSLTSLIRNGFKAAETGPDNWQHTVSVEIEKHSHNLSELEVIAEATKDIF